LVVKTKASGNTQSVTIAKQMLFRSIEVLPASLKLSGQIAPRENGFDWQY
jgi:hypothetical protein